MIAKVSLNENRASHLCLKAQLLYNCGKFKEALESCDLAFEADASNIDNLLLLSTIHFEKKSFEESEFYCKLLLEVDPNCAEAYSNYGNAVRELRQHDFAMELYQKATKLKPKFADAYNNLANVYLEKG
jgi:protein O-GlcNAc transferase